MATIGKVSAVFTASTSGLKAGVSEASSAFKKLQTDVAGLRSGMRSLVAIQGAQLFGQVASAAMDAARSFVSMGQAQAQTIDTTSKLSRRLGMTYGELAGLGLAGDLAGVSMETIGKAATKADVAFVKAAQGSAQAQAALAGVGLSVDQLQNKSPAERFQAMADAIAGLPTPAERARASIALFGKSGADLLPLFEGGAGSIRAATEEANKFGLALTDEQGVAVEGMNDAFTRAFSAIQGVVQQVVAYLAPALQSVTDTFTNLVGGIGGANIGQFIGEGIIAGATFLATITDAVVSGLGSAWEYAGTVVDVFNRAVSAMQAIWFTGEAVFKGVAALIARTISYGASILEALPDSVAGSGWKEFGASMEKSASELSAGAEKAAGNALDAAGRVVTGEQSTIGAFQGTGPVSEMVAAAKAAAEQQAKAQNQAAKTIVPEKPPTPAPEPVFTGPSAEALKATDSRSKEGIAEMFRLMRGESGNVQEQQLGVLEQIRDAVSEGDDMETADIAG